MANLNENDVWAEGVYQIEQTDPVLGGPPNEATKAGLSNIPHLQLARRTRWLKTKVDELLETVVNATSTVAGIVRLSTSVTNSSTTTAATASAVKAANDNANTRVPATRAINVGGLATGGGALNADRTIAVPVATEAQAQARSSNSVAMTPLRTAQAIVAEIIASSAGAVGTFMLAKNMSSETINTSNLIAGSSLRASSAAGAIGSVQAGTWKAMSITPAGDVGLFLRIA